MQISWKITLLPSFFLRGIFLVVVSLTTLNSSFAEPIALTDIDSRYEYYRITYQLHENYTHEESHEWAIKILNQRAIERLKTTQVNHSTSIEKLDILSAYNKKADGTRIDAPKTNYQVNTNSGHDKNSPVFSDQQSIETVFPDVQVGDTLVFAYKITTTEPMFPGYFATGRNFYESIAYDNVEVKIITPANIKALYQSNKMTQKVSSANNQTVYTWHFINQSPKRESRTDYSVWNQEDYPGFWFSTFESYQAIAEAYGKRALPKVVVNESIKKLAEQIIGKETNPKEQARLLYEWVAVNISYAGNCVGVGAVVPHDISFILDNKMGDCKDHATLLQALLTAKNIRSTQALINAGSTYQLSTIPMVSAVNHVINYLPDFDLFVDSTSPSTPFGMLPQSIQGKPVLLVENFKPGMKTPIVAVGHNKQTITATLDIAADGSVNGEVSVSLQGEPAVEARRGWRRTSKDSEAEWLKNYFKTDGVQGSGSMVKDDPKPLLDTFNYTIKFTKKEFIQTEGAAGLYIYPIAPSYFAISDLINIGNEADDPVETTCGSAFSTEEYTYTFANNFKILDVPSDKTIAGNNVNYQATYKLDKNKLHIKRSFEDKTLGPTCKPDLIKAQQEILKKIKRNLKAQIVYKPLEQE